MHIPWFKENLLIQKKKKEKEKDNSRITQLPFAKRARCPGVCIKYQPVPCVRSVMSLEVGTNGFDSELWFKIYDIEKIYNTG